jgi:Protein of unknown function (DUF3761)
MQQPPYDPNQPTWQGLPQQSLPSLPGWRPPGPPPQPPKKHRRRWPWIIGILIGALVLCIAVSVAAANTPTQQAAQPTPKPTTAAAVATATTAPTSVPTATPTPSPQPTVKPTAKPTQLVVKPTPKPQPTPTPKPHCVAVNNNPWCYNFSPGGLIYTPPSGFCGYFNCIPTFYASDDPGDGYIVECNDGTYSQSGGESGACSHHGGVMRPLYSH